MDLAEQFILREIPRRFRASFSQRAHPDAAAMEAEVFEILDELQVDQAVVSGLQSTRLGDSYGRMIPDAPKDGLRLCMMNSAIFRLNEVW